MNEHPSPEFENEIREILSTPNADPTFVRDLRATLIERTNMKKQTRSFYRLAWGLAFAILLIGLLIASPRVAQALKRLLGYIPGIGYVEQGTSLRVLSAPVTLEKDGLKFTIEKGAVDSSHTILFGSVEGYKPKSMNGPICDHRTRLILPDGTTLEERQLEVSGNTSNDTWSERYVFEPMPAGQMDATLEIPCLMNDPDYPDWTLQLHLQNADATQQVIPVIDLPTQSEEGTHPASPSVVPATSAESTVQGFSIVLESETPLPDGYILSGSYQWTDPRFDGTAITVSGFEIVDASGKQVDYEFVDPGVTPEPLAKKTPFAYQIHGKNYAFPLTIKVSSLNVNLPSKSTFQFDAGADPHVGQKWNMNIDVPVGEHVLHIETIELVSGNTPGALGFNFTMTSDLDVVGADLSDINPVVTGNGAGGGGGSAGGASANNHGNSFESGWFLEGYSPAGLKTFVVSNITVLSHGTWQAQWLPTKR